MISKCLSGSYSYAYLIFIIVSSIHNFINMADENNQYKWNKNEILIYTEKITND